MDWMGQIVTEFGSESGSEREVLLSSVVDGLKALAKKAFGREGPRGSGGANVR
jgi:hypothetical protein